jgi:putative methyltransferase (TIGR04325 family)
MLGRILRSFASETLHGYEHPELTDVIFRKTIAFEPTGEWPEFAGANTVLDFGGGCGLHYKQAFRSLPREAKWAVVETPAMVSRAKALETEQLKFFVDIQSAAAWLGAVDVMHSNGALQYVPDPLKTLDDLCALGAKTMLWQRLKLSDANIEKENQVSRLAENGPGKLSGTPNKNVSYTLTKIPRSQFLQRHHGYEVADAGVDHYMFVKASG